MTGLILIMCFMGADNVLGRIVYFNELANRGNISWTEWDSLLAMGASGDDTAAVVFALDKLVSKGKLSAAARDSVMQEYSLLKGKTGKAAPHVVVPDSVLARVVYFNELMSQGISWQTWDSLLALWSIKGEAGAVAYALDGLVSSGELAPSARDSIAQKYSLSVLSESPRSDINDWGLWKLWERDEQFLERVYGWLEVARSWAIENGLDPKEFLTEMIPDDDGELYKLVSLFLEGYRPVPRRMGHFLSESSNLVVAQAALDILGEMALTEIGCGCIAVAASISDTDSWWREHGPTWFTVISGCLFGLFGPGVYTDIVKEEHLESEILRRQEMNDALNYYINKYGECAKVFWLERKPPRNISMDEIPSDVRSEFYQMLDSALLVDRMWNELGWPSYVYELPGGYEIWVYREGTEYYLKTDLIGNVLLSSVSYPKFSTGHLPKKSEFEGELAKLKKPSFLFPYQVGYLLMTCAIVGLTYIALQEVNDWKRSGGE